MRIESDYRVTMGAVLLALVLLLGAALGGQSSNAESERGKTNAMTFVPNGALFPNPAGTSSTYSTVDGGIDLAGPFFQSLGTNGRSCGTCHRLEDGMSVSAASIERRFAETGGLDPIFRPVDGANCDVGWDVSTVEARRTAYDLLRTRGVIRVAITLPPGRDFTITSLQNPYGCDDPNTVSMYRRPLPATNLRFLSAVMWDGRESSALTGTEKILYNAAEPAAALVRNLLHQSFDATVGHAEGDGTRPTASERQRIVDFELALFTAQTTTGVGQLWSAHGATGGPIPLVNQPFFIGINSSVRFLLPPPGFNYEYPGGLTPGDGQFTPDIFDTFASWGGLPGGDQRASIARGLALFNSKPITITDVSGITDDVSAGGLVPGGVPGPNAPDALVGTCGTCHDTPNVGNHSFPTPLNIGVGDPSAANASVNRGGLDIRYLPRITACRNAPPFECITTTDLGLAAIDGKFDHIGKMKGPILRGLSARAPYFHNGSARTLLDVVSFYEVRFGMTLTEQERADLVAFLSAL
jgi:cytochrome c peroxidase